MSLRRRKTLGQRMDAMSPKELLTLYGETGRMFTQARKNSGAHYGPAKGPRGVKRRAKKRRHRANVRKREQVLVAVTINHINKHGLEFDRGGASC